MNQLLLPLLLMLVVAIPLVMGTRKQKKAAAAQQELLSSLAPGDRVMTTSGLYASVADASADTTIDLEIAPGVVTTWLRQAVREKVEPVVETDEDILDDEAVDETIVEAKDDERVEEKSGAQIAPPLEHGKK
ncbi:preprotein translocase subunit YajC [Amycolatopsis regifaucium]|uniref:Preprotein translocase subunit YajC n=1 Tax=Amycolatopsis regifaucium TaxID=546365 RepID=A0A154MR11_9PSEU|nr:preprotein translocase subunit YajC [Amycolatopsis regifaucium]KZB86237.1 preprotein translocase subunit YajC [Amycolatopsis regifaucium]OKA05130.1 preprotein translocase subunit YajC [Amycolatopsis regifaucium]SFH83068.1 preprotein translocase subunit YajC [Amycolatopsis regifaucium]